MAIPNSTSRNLGVMGIRLIDDAHVAWMEAEVESEYALRAWLDGPTCDCTVAYLVYRAAIDREEAAARDLRQICELTSPDQG